MCPTLYLAHGNSKGEARGRNSHQNHSKRVVIRKGRNVGKGKSPKHITRAKDLTIIL